MKYLTQFVKVIIVLALIAFGLFLVQDITYVIWTSGGQFITQPNSDILLTAEYLYNNPLPTPKQIEKLYINQDEIIACVRTYGRVIGGDVLFTRWFLNGERAPFERYQFFRYWVPDYCLGMYGVEPGLHLLEIHINSSPFYTAMSYQWAIKIEPTGTPTPSLTPSAP